MKRTLLASGAALALLAGPLAATPALADGAVFRDPTGDSLSAATDITQVFVALNREVFSTTITVRQFVPSVLERGFALVLDTDRDGETDYVVFRGPESTRPALYDGDLDEVPDCPVELTSDAAGRTATLSTTAACIGAPVAVQVSVGVGNPDEELDVDGYPDGDEFSAAVTRYEVRGAIAQKWYATGGAAGPLRDPLTDETPTTRDGAYNIFVGGTVIWSPTTGAHVVRGAIRSRWATYSSEYGGLGFPVTDEVPSARNGAVNVFEGGSVYWSNRTDAHALYGAIRDAWSSQGFEAGRLGFPTTEEFDAPDGRKQEFQGGNIVWTPGRGAVIAYPAP